MATVNHTVFPVILSGGAGTRLWPLSREYHPKQFLALLDESTLLQSTARRLSCIESANPPIVLCNERHRFMVAEQLRSVDVAPAAILLEPMVRNTAPAIAAAALEALAQCGAGDEPILLVLPCDHVIQDAIRFEEAVRAAVREAARGNLVAFGVIPTYAEPGYGYILAGTGAGSVDHARQVKRFQEKPDVHTAAALIAAGNCYWNSGMFAFGARTLLRELEEHGASILRAVEKAHANATSDLGFTRLNEEYFEQSPSLSVDYAVMECTANAVVVPLDAGWRDIGSWTSVVEHSQCDEEGNVVRGDVVVHDSRDCLVFGSTRLVTAVGVTGLVIVDTADAVLVAEKDAVQNVTRVVRKLEQSDRDEQRIHRKVYRPWGSYDSVYNGEGFNVKHIVVQPGQRLSLQAHRHRAEHWIVVRGVARVTRDDETFMVQENESTYIPQGARHRLENAGETPLGLIEVQTGSYFGEDDIERFEDAYGRAGDPSESHHSGSTE